MQEVKATSSQPIYHDNNDVIHKIHGFKEEGMKINLFIGRRPSENDGPLPEPRQGEVWVSLDIEPAEPEYPIDSNRLHLVVDCNQSDQMRSISNLFDKVIIDTSTIKFFDNKSFPSFVDLVGKGGSFIYPSEFQFMQIGDENDFGRFNLTVSGEKQRAVGVAINECFKAFCMQFGEVPDQGDLISSHLDSIINCEEYKEWAAQLDFPISECSVAEYPLRVRASEFLFYYAATKEGITTPSYKDEQAIAREKTKEDLQNHFNDVQIHYNEPYPYCDGAVNTYFIASDRK